MARVEPFETGTYKFWCDCGYEDVRFGCSRVVNDSEPNFSCEKPIIDASDQKCKLRWKLAPLVDDYTKQKAKDDARAFLASVEQKKQEAMATLGIDEAELNTIKAIPVSDSSSTPKEA